MHANNLYKIKKVMPITFHREQLKRHDGYDVIEEIAFQVNYCDLIELTNWLWMSGQRSLNEKLNDHIN